jgi:hypothetical protein
MFRISPGGGLSLLPLACALSRTQIIIVLVIFNFYFRLRSFDKENRCKGIAVRGFP